MDILATRIPEETINKIRTETNIVDVISQYVQLKKRGKNYFGFCPFHDERTPSFSVTDEKQIFHCFSCGRGGNIFTFLMEIESISFVESVKKAADLSGVSVQIDTHIDQPRSELQTKKDQLLAVHESATAFYHQVLMNTVTGEEALKYLKERGFTTELLEEFQIGFSPSDKTATQQIMKQQNYSEQLMRESGIFSDRTDSDELLDRFASRIIFPLRNERGQTIAFSGRTLPKKAQESSDFHEAKYLNSPETVLFSKRNYLFNLDKARVQMRKTSEVVLFEGYMDVISAWDAGVKNGVASMGTALTEEQIRILNKMVDSVVITFDGDRAGLEATKKAVDLLNDSRHFEVSVFPMLGGMDPDDYIQQKGASAFLEGLSNQRESSFQFQSRYLKANLDLDSETNRLVYLEKVLRMLVEVDSIIERELYLNELSEEFELDPAVLKNQLLIYQQEFMRTNKRNTKPSSDKPTFVIDMSIQQQMTKSDLTERQLLNRLFHHEEAWHYLNKLSPDFNFTNEQHQTIYLLYSAFHDEMQSVGFVPQFLDRLKDSSMGAIVTEITMNEIQSEVTEQEIADILSYLENTSLMDQLKQKNQAMKQATRNLDMDKAKSLLQEIIFLNRELKKTKK